MRASETVSEVVDNMQFWDTKFNCFVLRLFMNIRTVPEITSETITSETITSETITSGTIATVSVVDTRVIPEPEKPANTTVSVFGNKVGVLSKIGVGVAPGQ